MTTETYKRSPIRTPLGIFLAALSLLGASSLAMKEYRLMLFGEQTVGVVRKVEKITTSTQSKWVYRNGKKTAIRRGGTASLARRLARRM